MIFIGTFAVIYLCITVLCIWGVVLQRKELIRPWLFVTWAQLLTLTVMGVVALSRGFYIWLTETVICIFGTAFLYHAILRHYHFLVQRNLYDFILKCLHERY